MLKCKTELLTVCNVEHRTFLVPAEGRLSEDAGGGENQRVLPPSSVRRVWAKRRTLEGVWGDSRNENGWGWGFS